MRAAKEINGYDFIIEMLRTAGQEHNTIVNRIFNENQKNERSFLYRLRKIISDSDGSVNSAWAYSIIIDTVYDYIYGYYAPASTKQTLYNNLYALCESIRKQHGIVEYSSYLEVLPAPVTEDITIALIKELHGREGITKKEFAHKHHVSQKTVQNLIKSLSGNKMHKPLRIGGYAVYVPVESFKKHNKRDEKQRYYTPDTLNPVILQMNVIQAASLLQSFHYSNQKGNIIPFDMAIDTWCQLSEYTRKRIREIFCKDDPDFSDFLEDVDQESKSISYRFMSESELLSERDISIGEQLKLAFKAGLICDITLTGPYRTRSRQRVFHDSEQRKYYAVAADNVDGERLYFDGNNLLYLCESESL